MNNKVFSNLLANNLLSTLRSSISSQVLNYSSSTRHNPPFWKDYETNNEFQKINQRVGKNHKRFKHIYACGMPLTGALGKANLVIPKIPGKGVVEVQNTPNRVYFEKTSKLVDFDCGFGFSVFVRKTKNDHQVLGCGLNTSSQLGFQKGSAEEGNPLKSEILAYILEPQPIILPMIDPKNTRVKKVSCGRAHTALLTDKEGIFTLGNNAFGQCGRQIIQGEMYEGSRKVHRIPHDFFPSEVVDVVCGMDHTLFLTEDGTVYSCGWGADGQTGLGVTDSIDVPTIVGGDLKGKKVKSMSTFADTNLAVSDTGEVFGWGSSEYYQLACVTDSTQVAEPAHLPFKSLGKVSHVSCGGTGCILLNDKGEVYVWGYGILGKGPTLEQSQWPKKIPPSLFGKSDSKSDVHVTSVASGHGHFMAITNKGELFAWGKNKSGCLGTQSNEDQYFPWKVILGSEAKKVRLGFDHSIIMTESCF